MVYSGSVNTTLTTKRKRDFPHFEIISNIFKDEPDFARLSRFSEGVEFDIQG